MSDNVEAKTITPVNPEEQKKVLEQFKVTLRLAKIGEHFLNFIVQCRKMNVPPSAAIRALKEVRDSKKDDNNKSTVPILLFAEWMQEPSEEKFQALQKSLGVKIDKIVQEELIAQKSTEEKPKES